MPKTAAKPFNQKIRLHALRVLALGLFPAALVVQPALGDVFMGEVLEQTGIALVIAGILGRFWSILYIGGYKDTCVMDQGPYSMCRHPLYFFSTMAVLGFGLMVQSLVFAVFMAGVVFLVLNATASREEAYLRHAYGPEYDAYAKRTPRILPNPFLFRTTETIRVNISALRTNFFDALVFVAFIPLAESIEEARDLLGLFTLWLY